MNCEFMNREPLTLPRFGRGGFTLAELLVSIVLISLMMVYLLSIRNNAIREAQVVKNSRTAWKLAEQKYSEIQDRKYPSRIGGSGTFDEHEDFQWDVRVKRERVGPGDLEDDERKKRKNVYRVELKITYPGIDPDEEKSFKTVFYQAPPSEDDDDVPDHMFENNR